MITKKRFRKAAEKLGFYGKEFAKVTRIFVAGAIATPFLVICITMIRQLASGPNGIANVASAGGLLLIIGYILMHSDPNIPITGGGETKGGGDVFDTFKERMNERFEGVEQKDKEEISEQLAKFFNSLTTLKVMNVQEITDKLKDQEFKKLHDFLNGIKLDDLTFDKSTIEKLNNIKTNLEKYISSSNSSSSRKTQGSRSSSSSKNGGRSRKSRKSRKSRRYAS